MGNRVTSQFILAGETWHAAMALIVASAVVMGSPGPSTISVTAMGAAFGFRRSLKYAFGLISGTLCVLLAVAGGVVALLLTIPLAGQALEAISVLYILYLAFKIATAPPLEARGEQRTAPAFLGGFVLAVANPKAWLAIAAVLAGTTVVVEDAGMDALVKIVLLSAMIAIIHIVWLFTGASLSRMLHDPRSSRVINVSLAVLLVTMTVLAVVR